MKTMKTMRFGAGIVRAAICLVFMAVVFAPAAQAQGLLSVLAQQEAGTAAASDAPPEAPGTGPTVAPVDYRTLAFEVRDAFARAVTAADAFPTLAGQALAAHSPDDTLAWLWSSVAVLGLSALAGIAALALTERWGRHRFLHLYDPNPTGRASKIGYLFTRALMMGAGLVVFAIVSAAVALAFVSGHEPSRVTVFTGLEAVAVILVLRIVFRNVLAPDARSHRMIGLQDAEAHALYRALIGVAGVAYVIVGLCAWMAAMRLDPDAHKLALLFGAAFACVALSGVAIAFRRPITRLISGGIAATDGAGEQPLWRRVATLLWLPVTLVYFAVAFLFSGVRVLLDLPAALGLVGAPVFALLVGAVVYGLLVLVIDTWLLPRLDSEAAQARTAEDLERAATSEGGEADTAATRAQAEAEALDAEGARSPYRELLDHGAAILSVVVGLGFLLSRWGVPLSDDRFLAANLFEIGLILFLGYMAYRAVAISIDRQIALESGGTEKNEDAEVGGAGESRLATLLPIFRNFLLITIVVIAGMIALSQLGVNIGPLFAGAGVVGLAVGFGAQTLIRDIFSGAFFLIDDAFRKGEYIDIGDVKGTVEKISIRSMQLRHHNGPLNTVPFGEIKFVKNFSRDWAMMKLAFRVTYDTDVERMRKLIKKFGQELLEHPDYGPKFLQPVKSQGVTALEDSAMIVRVKFMTRPGDQFELRKVVYAGIRDLCEREGIHFAHREVTVRVQQEADDPRQFSEAEKKAIGGAVLPVVDEQAAQRQAATTAAAEGR